MFLTFLTLFYLFDLETEDSLYHAVSLCCFGTWFNFQIHVILYTVEFPFPTREREKRILTDLHVIVHSTFTGSGSRAGNVTSIVFGLRREITFLKDQQQIFFLFLNFTARKWKENRLNKTINKLYLLKFHIKMDFEIENYLQ